MMHYCSEITNISNDINLKKIVFINFFLYRSEEKYFFQAISFLYF